MSSCSDKRITPQSHVIVPFPQGAAGEPGQPGQPGKEGKRVSKQSKQSKQRRLTSCVAWPVDALTGRPWPGEREADWPLWL